MSEQVGRDSCYFCDNENTEVHEEHHIVPRRFGGSDHSRNLVQLCPTCHRKIERLYGARFYNTLGVGDGVPTGEALVRELNKVRPSYDDCEGSIDGAIEYKYALLKQFGLDPYWFLCQGCYNINVPDTSPDGQEAGCPQCAVSRDDVSFESNILNASFIDPWDFPKTKGDYSG